MSAIIVGVQFLADTAERFIVDEGAQQLVMTGAPLVRAGENCIHNTEPAGPTDPLRRQPLAGRHHTVKHRGRVL